MSKHTYDELAQLIGVLATNGLTGKFIDGVTNEEVLGTEVIERVFAFSQTNIEGELPVMELIAHLIGESKKFKHTGELMTKVAVDLQTRCNNLEAHSVGIQESRSSLHKNGIAEGRKQVQEDIDASEKRVADLTNQVEIYKNLLEDEDFPKYAFDIGDKVVDSGGTGVEGTMTRVCEYMDGSYQCFIESSKNGVPYGIWVEIDRLQLAKEGK